MTFDAVHCPQCGRAADADGNGLPDALDKVVQTAAQNAVAAERARTSTRRQQNDAANQRRLDVRALEVNLATPRTWWGVARGRFRDTFLLMIFVMCTVGMLPRMILASTLGFSLAGPALCLVQCPACGAPGRAFSWNYRGSWQENKGRMGSAYVCENPVADPRGLSYPDVRSEPLNSALQPYIVHNFWIFVGDVVGWSLVVAALRALFGTRAALAALDTERADLERRLRAP
ncbi:MAG: hypothetical protein U0325_21760 [Polyangiales bacterium]